MLTLRGRLLSVKIFVFHSYAPTKQKDTKFRHFENQLAKTQILAAVNYQLLVNIYLFSFFAHTFQTLHVFPRFLNATLFPALFKRHTIPLSPQLNLNLNIYFCAHCWQGRKLTQEGHHFTQSTLLRREPVAYWLRKTMIWVRSRLNYRPHMFPRVF